MPFPAVTVCAPNSRLWPTMVEALNHFDSHDLIFDLAKNISWTSEIHKGFYGSFKKKLILDQFTPELRLDQELPVRLKLFPIEKEAFYLMHILCFVLQYKCTNELKPLSTVTLNSILSKNPHQETAVELKTQLKVYICKDKQVNCSFLDNEDWIKCINIDNGTIHQDWCKSCKDLKACLYNKDNYDKFLQLTINIFYTWRKYVNKENLIHSFLSIFIQESEYSTLDFINGFTAYFNRIQPIDDSNLNLLDAWAYTTGGLEDSASFKGYIDNAPIEALENCTIHGFTESCHYVENLGKTFGKKQQLIWEGLKENIYDEFIPLCSFASQTLSLKKCTAFRKSKTKAKNGQCFTFEKASLVPKLGETQGLNILVNYAFPGTPSELEKPITISLHEAGQMPDIGNIKGKNFFVNPGWVVDLKISTIIIDTTKDFDAMNFESRLCNNTVGYGEVDCITESIFNRAKMDCRCLPIYFDTNSSDAACDVLGLYCFEESILDGIRNQDLHEGCNKACKRIQYGLSAATELPMTQTLSDFESYGEEFTKHFLHTEKLYDYLGYVFSKEDFLKPKLEKASLIRINFDGPEAMTVTKDAKITLPDMIGNIGGTLGVFIGFSFIGFLDSLIELFQYLNRKMRKITTQ